MTDSRLGCRFDDQGFALAFGLELGTRRSLDESSGQEKVARIGNFKEHTVGFRAAAGRENASPGCLESSVARWVDSLPQVTLS